MHFLFDVETCADGRYNTYQRGDYGGSEDAMGSDGWEVEQVEPWSPS